MLVDLLMIIIGAVGGLIGRTVLLKRYMNFWKNPGPSPLAGKDARSSINTISKMIFFTTTLPLMLWMIFFFIDIFNPEIAINRNLSLIRGLLLLVYGIGTGYSVIYMSCVFDMDCDVKKYDEMMQILNEQANGKGRVNPRSDASRNLRRAACSAVMDDENYFENTMELLAQCDMEANPHVAKRTIYMDTRLKLFARYGDLNELIGCDQYLAQFMDKQSLRLREEALVHIYMLQGYYDQVKALINKHMQSGDSILSHLYREYYMARMAIEEGDIESARVHSKYVFDFGGTTFYPTALKNYIIAKNVDIEVPFSNI